MGLQFINCSGENCDRKKDCYRYTHKPEFFQIIEEPTQPNKCDRFIDKKNYPDNNANILNN
jgi:hypothetical protein